MQDSAPCHRMWRCNGAVRCHRSATLIQWTVLLASSLHSVRAVERNRLIRTGLPGRAADSAAGGVLLDVKTKAAVSIDAHADISRHADVGHVGTSSNADRTRNATGIAVFFPRGELALQTHTNGAPRKLHTANKSWKRPHVPLRRPLVRPQSAIQVSSDATVTTQIQVFSTKSDAEELISLSDKLPPGTRHRLYDDQDFMRQEPVATAAPVAVATAAPVAAAPAAGAVAAVPAVAAAAPVAGAVPAVAAAAPADGTAPVAAAAPADGTAPALAVAAPEDEEGGTSLLSWLFVIVFLGGIGGGAFMYWKKKQSSQIRGRLGEAAHEPEGQGFKAKRSTYRKAVLEKGDEESGSDNSEDDTSQKATSSAVGAGSEFSRPTSSRNRGASAAGSAASGGDAKEKDSTGGSQGSRSYKDRRANK